MVPASGGLVASAPFLEILFGAEVDCDKRVAVAVSGIANDDMLVTMPFRLVAAGRGIPERAGYRSASGHTSTAPPIRAAGIRAASSKTESWSLLSSR
jgi:hypothetical protein